MAKNNQNNFRKEKAIEMATHRLYVKYKPEWATKHGAFIGDFKVYYNYKGQTPQDLADMITDTNQQGAYVKHVGHYEYANLYEKNVRDGDILRAWDHNARELRPDEVKRINDYLKFKRKQKQATNSSEKN